MGTLGAGAAKIPGNLATQVQNRPLLELQEALVLEDSCLLIVSSPREIVYQTFPILFT